MRVYESGHMVVYQGRRKVLTYDLHQEIAVGEIGQILNQCAPATNLYTVDFLHGKARVWWNEIKHCSPLE